VLTDRHRERLLGYAFVAPVAIFLLALVAYPFLSAIYLSLTEKMVGYPARFVGLRNYETLFDSARFRIVVRNSAVFTGASIVVKLVVGMAMALALHKVVRGNQFIRGILLLPWVIPTVVIALTWKWLLDLFRGLVNVALIDVGAVTRGVHWLFNIVFIMTRGGPGAATHVFATYGYELGIMSQRWGLAMASSMASLPLVALLIVGVVRYLHREEE